jgi:hypothetical protein
MVNVPLVAHHAEPGLLSAERLQFLDSSNWQRDGEEDRP